MTQPALRPHPRPKRTDLFDDPPGVLEHGGNRLFEPIAHETPRVRRILPQVQPDAVLPEQGPSIDRDVPDTAALQVDPDPAVRQVDRGDVEIGLRLVLR